MVQALSCFIFSMRSAASRPAAGLAAPGPRFAASFQSRRFVIDQGEARPHWLWTHEPMWAQHAMAGFLPIACYPCHAGDFLKNCNSRGPSESWRGYRV
jgi:hypothetical protein